MFPTRLAALSVVMVATGTVQAAAQAPSSAPAAAMHKHYEVSAHAQQPGPNGELAPRLQNLGAHTFPVSTRNRDAFARFQLWADS